MRSRKRSLVFAGSIGQALVDYAKTGESAKFRRSLNMNAINFGDDKSYRKVLNNIRRNLK